MSRFYSPQDRDDAPQVRVITTLEHPDGEVVERVTNHKWGDRIFVKRVARYFWHEHFPESKVVKQKIEEVLS